MKRIRKIALTVLMLFSLTVGSVAGMMPVLSSDGDVTIAEAVSTGKRNALAKAKQYLKIMAFSKKGLKDQLKFEGFTNAEAKYGVDNCGANWKKQAVKKAKSYMKIMAMSKKQLYDQLIFDGFTKKQAKYGVKKAYK